MHVHSEKLKDAEIDRVAVNAGGRSQRAREEIKQMPRAQAGETGQPLAQARAKAEQSLKAARARVADLQRAALVKTRAGGRATDDYVRANAWQVMAIAAAYFVFGLLLARDGESDS